MYFFFDDVWDRYKELAEKSLSVIKHSFLNRITTFREKLQSRLDDIFNFFQPVNKCPSERKTRLISMKCLPAAILKHKDETQKAKETLALPQYEPDDDIILSLIHVALKIHWDIMATPGHKCFSVSEDEAVTCVPDSLYMLLKVMFGGQEVLEGVNSDENENIVQNQVLSVVLQFGCTTFT